MLQKEALEILKMGKNVFLTGPAGSGKTYLLNQYIGFLKSKEVPVGVTASTGIAATHLNGLTIHSWSGLGVKNNLSDYDIEKLLKKTYLKKQFKSARVLVIDEISMLNSFQLDAVDKICRAFKQTEKSFGGLQIVLCGDFFQLPPINKNRGLNPPEANGQKEISFAYQSDIWTKMDLQICYLDEQYRQNLENDLLSILNDIRQNKISAKTRRFLEKCRAPKPDKIIPTKLYTHNREVDALNLRELEKIGASPKIYQARATGRKKLVESLKKSCLAMEELRLKKDAVVMFVKNNFEIGYVNGTLGIVIGFEKGLPIIKTYGGKKIIVNYESWHIEEDGAIKAKITQIPLRLAWAITVHKSQGMSLDAAEIDLSKSFVEGMGYVALSRVRSLEGLYLKGINEMALKVNESIFSFDQAARKKSAKTVRQLKITPQKRKEDLQKEFLSRAIVKISKEEKISTYELTKKLAVQEMTIGDMARERKMTVATIINHLEKLAEDKGSGRVDLKYLKQDIKDFEKIKKAWAKTKGDKLTPVKKILPDNISFEDIRVVKLLL
ncbi:MAG: AAA family ATPase [Candidatus Pacebacteria bacterium]|nr:AAA family ATPase [Candidatus Paceibacterota bacterium]